VDPHYVLRADRTELPLLVAAVREAHAFALARDQALARRVVYELSEALKRGKR
jgi:hypothetical protein